MMSKTHINQPLGEGVPAQYATWHALGIQAINDEIKAVEDGIARWGGDKPVNVVGGALEGSEGEVVIYTVILDRAVFPPEYTSVELNLNGRISRGVIEAIDSDGKGMTLALDAILPGGIERGILTFNPTAILKATKEQLMLVGPGLSASDRKLAGVLRALGLGPVLSTKGVAEHESLLKCGLNQGQRGAVTGAAESDMHLVFGPPGTGKTKTVGPLVATATEGLGERVLVVAHTNTALDTAMAAIVEAIDPRLVGEGKVVRVGKASRDFEHLGLSLKEAAKRSRGGVPRETVEALKAAEKSLAALAPPGSIEAGRLAGIKSMKTQDVPKKLVLLISAAELLSWRFRNTAQLQGVDSVLVGLREIAKNMQDAGDATLRQASIVGMTLSKLALLGGGVSGRFDRVVVDEGSMAMLVQVMLAASMADKITIFGDPRQLPPVVQARTAAAKRMMSTDVFTHLGLSDPSKTDPRQTVLKEQYRMSASIREVVSRVFYENVLVDGMGMEPEEKAGESVWFVDTSDTSALSQRAGSSWVNEGHVEIISQMIGELGKRDFSDIGVITPFAAQSRRIRADLHAKHRHFTRQGFVRTIHGAQGGEKDIIILDLVDAGSPGSISGFLDDRRTEDLSRLLCVAASRARTKLIILAHTKSFRAKYGRRGKLMNFLEEACRAGRYHRLPESWRNASGEALFPDPNEAKAVVSAAPGRRT